MFTSFRSTLLISRSHTTRRLLWRLSLANFERIQHFVEYKAKWHGIRVSYVNPAHTPLICPFYNSKPSLPIECENKGHTDGNSAPEWYMAERERNDDDESRP
ncbi:MAG TPA: hypothetical protein ENK81_00405 [Euryarchaeota archaeon]|nr:hypothetical protein [Euryarchaeota archaeon]